MTDYFALLGVPRRPWLDADQLKEQFQAHSAECHPDRVHNSNEAAKQLAAAQYPALNEAYQCLREPKSRIHHLLCLERGAKPGDTNRLPESLMNLFSRIGPLLREMDGLLREKSRAGSSVERALIAARAIPCLDRVATAQRELASQRAQLNGDLGALDARWLERTATPIASQALLDEAERLYHHFGFLDRWAAQLQERSFELTL